MPLDWCATDACKTTTICNGLCTWTVSTARIYTLATRSLWTTSLASSWVLDCTIIADAVTATRTGSFMDGSATPTNCKIDGGNPWQTTQYRRSVGICIHPELWSASFSSQIWLTFLKRFCITTASSKVSSHAWRVHCITHIMYDVSFTGYAYISMQCPSLWLSSLLGRPRSRQMGLEGRTPEIWSIHKFTAMELCVNIDKDFVR